MRQLTRIYIGAANAILIVETQTGDTLPEPVGLHDQAGNGLVVDIWQLDLDGHADGRFTSSRELLVDIEKPAGADTPPRFKSGAARPLNNRKSQKL